MNFTFSSTYVALWLLIAFQGVLIIALLLKLDKLQELVARGSSLPIGTSAPQFVGVDQTGETVSHENLRDGGMILFLSPDCPVCKALADSIGSLGGQLGYTIAVCRGEGESCAALSKQLGSSIRLIVDQTSEITSAYGTSVFPRAVIIDDKKKIRGYAHPRNIDDLKRAFEESFVDLEAKISVT